MSRDLGTKLNTDSDIKTTVDEVALSLAKITGDWSKCCLTLNSYEDINLIMGKLFITNLKSSPNVWLKFNPDEFDESPLSEQDFLDDWEGTKVVFIDDVIASITGIKDNELRVD